MKDLYKKYNKRILLDFFSLVILALSILPLWREAISYSLLQLELILIFYLTIINYKFDQSLLLFCLGIWHDALSSYPLGSSSLIFLLFQSLIYIQLKTSLNNNLLMLWLFFILMTFKLVIIEIIIRILICKQSISILLYGLRWIITIFLYPAIHLILNQIYYSSNYDNR